MQIRPSWYAQDACRRGGTNQAHKGRAGTAARDADPTSDGDDDRSQRNGPGIRPTLGTIIR